MPPFKKLACLIYGSLEHHLDHLAPLAALFDIPLIVTEEPLAKLAKRYYPYVELIFWDYTEAAQKIIETFDVILCSFPRLIFEEIFYFAQAFANKRLPTIWCPHGNSDKGHHSHFMEALAHEQIALVYGKKMIDFFMEKKVLGKIKKVIDMGNLRLENYHRHKTFYNGIIQTELGRKLPQSPRTILYAPTWEDEENNSSFYSSIHTLIDTLPDPYNLIVKLHPNSVIKDEIKLDLFLESYQDRPNLLFLKHFPPIYPLIDFIDVYVGDMSSIGYDVLASNKPMYFLNHKERDLQGDPSLYLHRCGISILPKDFSNLYSIIDATISDDTTRFSAIRKETYAYTFGKKKDLPSLKEQVRDSLCFFSEEDLPL
jgi:hypothetical protein